MKSITIPKRLVLTETKLILQIKVTHMAQAYHSDNNNTISDPQITVKNGVRGFSEQQNCLINKTVMS